MKVYRITVDSAARQTGNEFDFEWDLSGFSPARDLKGRTWVAAVEWCDVPDTPRSLLPSQATAFIPPPSS